MLTSVLINLLVNNFNRGRADAERNSKKYNQELRDVQSLIEDEQRNAADAKEQWQSAERRNNALSGEVEEMRTQLESIERARKAAESELSEASDRVSELMTITSTLSSSKRKLENDCHAMQVDLEDQANELKSAGEASRKALADAARVAEELRQEQQKSNSIEKTRRNMEIQVLNFNV